MGFDCSTPLSLCTDCNDKKVVDCGICIAKFKSVNNFHQQYGDESLTLSIDEKEVCLTKIHAYLIEGRFGKIDVAVIEIKDKNQNIVFQDAFGDELLKFGTERYETTFVHPVKVKGPITATLSFYKFKPCAPTCDSAELCPVDRTGALTIAYCKDCDKHSDKKHDRD